MPDIFITAGKTDRITKLKKYFPVVADHKRGEANKRIILYRQKKSGNANQQKTAHPPTDEPNNQQNSCPD